MLHYSHIFNKTYKDKRYYIRSCKNAACYRKKLKDLKCEKCGLQHEENATERIDSCWKHYYN